MCEPVTLGMGMGAAGTVMQLLGQKDEGKYREQVAAQNADYAKMAAADAVNRGAQTAGMATMEGSAAVAEMKVGYGASGVDGTVGTPADQQEQVRALSALDAATIKNNAAREAWGFKMEAAKSAQEGEFSRRRTQAQMVSTVLGGASNFGNSYMRMRSDKKKYEDG